MKRGLLTILCLSVVLYMQGQIFSDYFTDKSLRVDYVFTGNVNKQEICLSELSFLPTWAGRRQHLAELPLEGNGQIIMRDAESHAVIYKTSFSSLFQEWLETDEAQTVCRGFENTFLLPYPIRPAEIEVILFDSKRNIRTCMNHTVNPADILIRERGISHITPHRYLLRSGDPDRCIDVAILAEGYTADEMDLFYRDAEIACESLFAHEPFHSLKKKFNIVAVGSASEDSGVSVPRLGSWKHTAFSSHFSTFYSDRYLTSLHVNAIHDALAGIPYEHIIILANTEEYGGGIYNSYTLTTAHHSKFRPVVVHEFGHSFAGLADEYYYDNDVMTDTYPLNVEPWEQNITTQVDFKSKWMDMLAPGTPIPTPEEENEKYLVGVYEGGGYSAKVYIVLHTTAGCVRMNILPSVRFANELLKELSTFIRNKSIQRMIKLQRIHTADKALYDFTEHLLMASFPHQEYRPLCQQREYTDNKTYFHNNLILDNDLPIGFITYWEFEDFYYIEHFAIDPNCRNDGYGKKVMEHICSHFKLPIVLEVEEPTTELAHRRIGFYQRQGFKLWTKEYAQPPYHPEDNYLPMRLMVYGKLDEASFERIRDKIYEVVYNV